MTIPAEADLCRITLVAPKVRLDVAVPATVPLAGLLPALLAHTGEDAVEDGATHGGWSLQRLGEPPLDSERTISALKVRDGEVLYFRRREEALPELTFDDPVDAMGHALRSGARRWSAQTTRVAALVAVGFLLTGAAVLTLVPGPPWSWSVVACAAVAAVLVICAAVVAWAFPSVSGLGTVLGVAATGNAFVAGLLALAGRHTLGRLGAPQLLVGFSAALVAAAVTAVVLDRLDPALTGLAGTAALGAIGAASAMGVGARAAGAIVAAVALTGVAGVSRIAYRLARLPQPELPRSHEELRRHGEPLPAADIARRTLTADAVMTAMAAMVSAASLGAGLVMLHHAWSDTEWAALSLSAVSALCLLLRARLFAGVWQRLWLIGAGLGLCLALAVRLTSWFGRAALPGTVVALALAAGFTALWAMKPERRISAPWARYADLLEFALTFSLAPLALEVLHVYSGIRSLAS